MSIQASTVKKIWSAVEGLAYKDLVNMDDDVLVTILIQDISTTCNFKDSEYEEVRKYIGDKILLVRDMAAFAMLS